MPFTSLPICLDVVNVVSVSAGLRHTAVATRDGRAYTWGHGHRGQLGHIDSDGQVVKLQPTPRVVDHIEGKVSYILCVFNWLLQYFFLEIMQVTDIVTNIKNGIIYNKFKFSSAYHLTRFL